MRIAVFGYGSLVNKASLEKTLGKNIKVQTAVLNGWKRDWSAILENTSGKPHYQLASGEVPPKVAVLNIKPSEDSLVNGILFDCSEQDLDRLINREIHYDLVDVTKQIETGGYDKVYSFTSKPQFTDTNAKDVIIPASYKNLVEDGFRDLGPAELDQYQKTTNPSVYEFAEAKFIH